MLPRPVIVATVRDAADVLDSFITYHLAIGFAHIYLFFDDPLDPCAGSLAGRPQVTAIRCDEPLRARWTGLRTYPKYREHVEAEVMARQILNCELAVAMAAGAGYDWILHIDSDELFWSAGCSAPEHFAALDFRGTDNAVYLNFEALPEALEIGDYFREVTLFKVNLHRGSQRRFDGEQVALMKNTRFADPHCNFHLYNNGKAAARLDARLLPLTVHEFARERADGTIERGHEVIGDSQLILHYPNCGFTKFLTKYRTLGSFGDKWFGAGDVIPFHREARDIVALGDEARAQEFYRERVMRHRDDDVELLTARGILRRIDGPAELLRRVAPSRVQRGC